MQNISCFAPLGEKINQHGTQASLEWPPLHKHRAPAHTIWPTNQIIRYITTRNLLTVQRLSRTLPCIFRYLVNVDKFLYVLIRSAQTKHKTFINIKHNTSSSGEGLLPRSSTNQSTGKGKKNIFIQNKLKWY